MIDIRQADDWVAIYNDGKKVYEGHSCPIHFGLEALGIKFTHEWLEPSDDDPYMNDAFPDEL